LLKAKQAGLVQTVIPALERLNDLGFRASHSTLLTVLKLAGEVNR
jgi:predicted nucleic acid-binding protein